MQYARGLSTCLKNMQVMMELAHNTERQSCPKLCGRHETTEYGRSVQTADEPVHKLDMQQVVSA